MRALLRRLLDRTAEKVNRSAAGTAPPAGLEPPKPGERAGPTARERTLMRRRLRALRKRRESHEKAGGVRPKDLEEIDAEIVMLRDALAQRKTLDELLASSPLTRCPGCGDLVSKRERQCPSCGTQLPPGREAPPHPAPRAKHAGSPAVPVATGASSARSRTPPSR